MNKEYERVKWQIQCDNAIKDKENVILSSPTGSGKTGRYEKWALEKKQRPIFITAPIKSLSNQRFRELYMKGYNVGLETGDIKYIPNEDCDVICCTQEIYNNKYREYEDCTLIIDEFSYIFENEERARSYIDSLHYSKAKNIMLCSATFGNLQKMKEYVDKLTGKDFFLYENKERLTTLEYKGELKKDKIKDSLVVAYSKNDCEKIAESIACNRLQKVQNLRNKVAYGNYDVRERNKNKILEIAKKYGVNNELLIEFTTVGVAYYYGALFPKEKLFIEELFEKKLIDTVVGTDALSLGVNFPIQNVVFAQFIKTRKGRSHQISKNLFEQLSGRAGRKGYFENGYVYYCNDFFYELDKRKITSNKKLFFELVKAECEDAQICLDANIKDILTGEKTIEQEALFITEYSTNSRNFYEVKEEINEIINFIKNCDIAKFYLEKKFYNLDFEQNFYDAIEECNKRTKNKIERLSNSLTLLQPYFDSEIGSVFMHEYSAEKNCILFIEILMNTPLENLIKRYGTKFYDLLLLRKYIYNLPEKYSKNYDLNIIDKIINSMDYTVLHPNEFAVKKVFDSINIEKTTTKKQKRKNKTLYDSPRYFDKILINDKEYMKILVEGNNILICDYSGENDFEVFYIPINTRYKLAGLFNPKQGLKILEGINISSLSYKDQDAIDKIEDMKVLLKNKYQ